MWALSSILIEQRLSRDRLWQLRIGCAGRRPISFLVSIYVIPLSHAFMEADPTKDGLMLRVSILSYVKPIHA
jgi:hypothetical protein